MRKIKLLAVIVSSFLVSNHLYAQEPLTLQQAIRYALEHKAEAQKSKLDVENADYQIDEVRAGALPQINGSASLKYNALIPSMPLEMGGQVQFLRMGQPWNSAAMLSVNQQIFNQALFTGLKAARTTREFYAINHQLTEEELIEKIATAYYDVYQAEMSLNTIETNLENTKKTYDVLKGSVDAGLAKQIDLDRVVVAINNLEAQKQQALNGYELGKNALKFAIGMDITQPIELSPSTFDVNVSRLVEDTDLTRRTEIQLLEKQAELLELDYKSKRAEYFPTLSFGGDIGYQGFGRGFPIGGEFAWFASSGLGLNLSIPIFNGGATRAKLNQANVKLKQLRVDIEDTKLGLNLALDNAKKQMKNSLLVIQSNEENVTLAKDVLANTQNNYNNGLATLTELLDAEKAYADAQNNYTTSLLNFKVAEIQLIKSRGELKSLINE